MTPDEITNVVKSAQAAHRFAMNCQKPAMDLLKYTGLRGLWAEDLVWLKQHLRDYDAKSRCWKTYP